jgi:hypothetical protein
MIITEDNQTSLNYGAQPCSSIVAADPEIPVNTSEKTRKDIALTLRTRLILDCGLHEINMLANPAKDFTAHFANVREIVVTVKGHYRIPAYPEYPQNATDRCRAVLKLCALNVVTLKSACGSPSIHHPKAHCSYLLHTSTGCVVVWRLPILIRLRYDGNWK